jgi:hypothetical protein
LRRRPEAGGAEGSAVSGVARAGSAPQIA